MTEIELTATQMDRIVERGTKFLSTASQVPAIRILLDRGGYDEAEHKRGWELLLEVLGYKNALVPAVTEDLRQRQALAELDAYDGPAFDRGRAALEHRYPDQALYVFNGLTAKSGAEAIGAVRTFLDRVAALREGKDPARAATRKEDADAAALLAKRRIVDVDEERRLRALIVEATSLPDMPTMNEPDSRVRQEPFRKLDVWLRDWRETARVLVTRRDYQIRLGLAERRAGAATDAATAQG